MCSFDVHCTVPPAPELLKKIIRTKQLLEAGHPLPQAVTADVLDLRSFTLITSRHPKTRAYMFPAAPRPHAPAAGTPQAIGTVRALVLLVDFSDNPATQNQQHYRDMLFSSGTYQTGSLRDFYWEASYNQLTVTGDVSGTGGPTTGWYRAPQPYSYYTNGHYGDPGLSPYPHNGDKLVEDVVDLAAPFVNFANYDNDGDGVVDALFIVHAGPGAEVTGNVNDIWAYQGSITPKTVNGVKVINYSIEPEDGAIGVFCHELGHVFGLPDLYDTDYTSAGTGNWDLMAHGSWNNGGMTPAHPLSWCKVQLGWVNPITIFNAAQSVTIQPLATNADVYKLPIKNKSSKEYFLLENRQRTGFDAHLPGVGLLISHIDENQTDNTDENHYLVDIEQADGRRDLNKAANEGDATDPYPNNGNNSFGTESTPNSMAYDGSDSKVVVTNIQRLGNWMTADINVGGVVVPPKPNYVSWLSILLLEEKPIVAPWSSVLL
jgi:immune inhibitor A